MIPVVLTIAGSDPSGGAGVQADLRALSAHRVFGAAVIACLTAQNTAELAWVRPVEPRMVRDQIAAVRADLPIRAIKIGLLGSAEVVDAVAAELWDWPNRPPVVLDTPLTSTTGHDLVGAGAVAALRRLLPLCALATPNAAEAAILGDGDGERWAARCGVPVLITGGDLPGDTVRDVLIDGTTRLEFAGARHPVGRVRGTGCALSAAIAARLAHGDALEDAVERGITWVRGAIADAQQLGRGARVLV